MQRLDAIARWMWPCMVAFLVGGSVYIVVGRSWETLASHNELVLPTLVLPLVLAYGLANVMTWRKRG